MNKPDSVERKTQFDDLVAAHGEANGGTEDFCPLDDSTIGCRHSDCCIRLSADGWQYGGNAAAYPTPAEAFENRLNDIL